jgi:hypothetical protein
MATKQEIKEVILLDGYVTLQNSSKQKFYIEEYHEYNKENDTYEANDDNGNTMYIKLKDFEIIS